MKRRQFLKSSLIAGAAALPTLRAAAAEEKPASGNREFYELRLYHLRKGPMTKRFDDYCRDAAIPVANRLGVGPIGVFSVALGPDNTTMYVLIPHKSAESFGTFGARLGSEPEYHKAGAPFITAPPSDPPYVRVESSLMIAFEGCPKLELPAAAAEKKPRIFELRTYESHSKKASKKKIEMFNQGELGIFRRVGLTPVFFGETLIGPRLPNLTYMITFEDMADREKKWGAFRGDEEWRKLRSKPEYADSEIVSNISNVLLRPTAYSQI